MKTIIPDVLAQGRVVVGPNASDPAWGATGAFNVMGPCGMRLNIVASDGEGWEHVSVSTPRRCPNWPEMCFVKGLFWRADETVMQLHPPESEYVNNHPYCLHLWRPQRADIPLPPSWMVGFKSLGVLR